MAIGSRSLWCALLALVFALLPAEALAQRARRLGHSRSSQHPAIRLLSRSRSPDTRSQAAQTLSRLRPAGAREALERALRDRSAGVRGAAAAALGALGDPAAIPALRERAAEGDPTVRGQVERALAQLNAGSVAARAPSALVPVGVDAQTSSGDLRRARFLVGVGTLTNGVRVAPRHLAVLRAAVAREIAAQRGLALRPEPLTSALEARVRRRQLRLFALDGGVSNLVATRSGADVTVRAEVSLILIADPAHAIVGTLSGAATAREAWSGQGRDPVERLEVTAIEGAVRSALSSLAGSLRTVRR